MVRQKGGIKSLSRNYEQRGVVATVEIEPHEPNHTAYQRFLADGSILAFLPCAENQVSIVWSCDNHRAASLQVSSEISRVIERILMEHIESTRGLNFKLFFIPICSIRIRSRK